MAVSVTLEQKEALFILPLGWSLISTTKYFLNVLYILAKNGAQSWVMTKITAWFLKNLIAMLKLLVDTILDKQ